MYRETLSETLKALHSVAVIDFYPTNCSRVLMGRTKQRTQMLKENLCFMLHAFHCVCVNQLVHSINIFKATQDRKNIRSLAFRVLRRVCF